jgi:hypothetical protein
MRKPTRKECLQTEWDLLGFTPSVHPIDLFGDIHLASYCPLNRAGRYVGLETTLCSLVMEQRIHHQVTGDR